MKEMNFIEAVKFKKENPDINVYRIDRANRKTYMEINSEDQIIYGKCDITIIKDIESIWIAEQSQRTHKEIMSNWFKTELVDNWQKVEKYTYNRDEKESYYLFDNQWRDKEYFNNLEMKIQTEIEQMED